MTKVIACCFFIAMTSLMMMVEALQTNTDQLRCTGTKNTIPLMTDAPRLVKTIKNAALYTAGADNDTFDILHLWGTPYEQGFAQGQIHGSAKLTQIHDEFYKYVEWLAKEKVPWLPQWLIDGVVMNGLPWFLQLTINITRPYTPQRYVEEFEGLAAGAGGLPVDMLWRLNMFPELIKAMCTVVGANKQSTPQGNLHHLRALDFPSTMPIKDYTQITVAHGHRSGEATVANFGWAGLIGVLTGFTNSSLGLGMKVWVDHPLSIDGVRGQPWMLVLRDALTLTHSLDDAIQFLQNANRTCAMFVGLGCSQSNRFRGITMAKRSFTVYNDTSIHYAEHPIYPGVVYWDKHPQPTTHWCLHDMLAKYYGNLTAPVLALELSAIGETGRMQVASFDYQEKVAYYANARKVNVTEGSEYAYNRQFTRIDMKAVFAVQKPNL